MTKFKTALIITFILVSANYLFFIYAKKSNSPETEQQKPEYKEDYKKREVIEYVFQTFYVPEVIKKELEQLLFSVGYEYGYDPLFLVSVMITESSLNQFALSKKHAYGIMQIKPSTGKPIAKHLNLKWHGNKSLYNLNYNVLIGTHYLRYLQNYYGNTTLALEAYNRGPTRLNTILKEGGNLNVTYSRKILQTYKNLKNKSLEG